MVLPLNLSEAEVVALTLEKLNSDESLEDVVKRQLGPIVERMVESRFKTLMMSYNSLPLTSKINILNKLEQLGA